MGKNTVQAKQWLDKYYPHSASLRRMIEKWFADFKRGHTNTDDAERSGSPKSAVVSENMSEGSVFTIMHEHLSIRKLCSKWVPGLRTADQKQHVDDSKRHHYTPVKSAVSLVGSKGWKPPNVT